MKIKNIAIAVALSMGMANVAFADTSSAIRGVINSPQGSPAAGTKITILHVPSGTSRQAVVNDSGVFNASGLRVGGPYRIIVDSDVYADTVINDVYLTLGETFQLQRQLEASNVERIQVAGTAISSLTGDTGPAARFDSYALEVAPSVNRDIKDVIRTDPRIYINETNASSIQCAGGSPRSNSLTVDGVRMNDNFGLNSSGYPTERIPFSFDAIDQVAVELAPFDVKYGGFTACNINAVTKSGSNKVSGSVFVDYTNDSMKGDKLEGDKQNLGSYNEKRYGVNVGFPIVQDKLFAFFAYEKLEGSEIFDYAPLANGRVTQAQIDEIISISKDIYNYDPGSAVPSMPVKDEKILLKVDWNINDLHRLNFLYNYNDGYAIAQSDAGSDRLSLSNHFYERGAELNAYVTSLYSDWTPDFSTEVRLGYSELRNRQLSIDAASGFGEVQILGVNGTTIYLGPDDSRQSNVLNYDNLSFKLAGTYYLDDHELYFGYEYENLDVFNLFVQNSVGQYRFANIDAFRNGLARAYYGNASSHNPNDAAGEFKYNIHTVYAQDKYRLPNADVTITAGLRYDWYTSDSVPTYNANFENRYGYSNQQNLDGKSLLQPRLGINWVATEQLEIRGGAGLYSGGNPNVWISNSYSNDGIRNIQVNRTNMQLLGPNAVALIGEGRPGYDIPQALYDAVGSGTADSSTNVTDPDFKIPSEWKYALGGTYSFDSGYVVSADLLHSRKKNSAIIKDLSLDQTGTAPDGRPVYTSRRGSNNDFLLTNRKDNDARSTVFSLSGTKSFDNGVDVALAYAYTDAKDVHPMNSSVAFSNYHFVSASDTENLALATSDYEIPHRFTLNLTYAHEFFAGYETRFSLFGQVVKSNSYGYTFDRSSSGLGFNDASRQLLYVPTLNDSRVVFATKPDGQGTYEADFNAWVSEQGLEGYRGSIMPRNALSGSWWNKFDIRVEQQFPGFTPEHKGSVYFVMENVGNFLNDDWGIVKEGSSQTSAVTTSVNANGQYVYTFNQPTAENRRIEPSLWEVRVGLSYKF
ncbi:Outer membrane receptor for ferrienterochelin and colicins [Rheinheimera pacifica]|uniref:Outer membrane receptor for ferrienterochelin and colicins n=1 Tax=Rheinheimera pacifica TaxID=173990 RepID=A0A1H6NCC2_9GAMM|nr:TonB-dependent receptor [Rheinheimera pacifica]SEI09370.1 Outer membrane receptor for ferrienterochelin and colicins [Rheinheimera pacifica]